MAKKNVEELYKAIFAIRDSLQDSVQLASEAANIAQDFGGEIAKVITAQLNQYFIPTVSKYIDNSETPGSMTPLITFLDSVPLAMTRQEPEPEKVTPAPIQTSLATPAGYTPEVPAEGSFAAQESKKKLKEYNLKQIAQRMVDLVEADGWDEEDAADYLANTSEYPAEYIVDAYYDLISER